MEMLASGVVLTGGASLLEGLPELAEQIFDHPAKIARPNIYSSNQQETLGPEYATSVGLVRYAQLSANAGKLGSSKKHGSKVFSRIKNIFSEYF
jgi:cell division protein FtsA